MHARSKGKCTCMLYYSQPNVSTFTFDLALDGVTGFHKWIMCVVHSVECARDITLI